MEKTSVDKKKLQREQLAQTRARLRQLRGTAEKTAGVSDELARLEAQEAELAGALKDE